MARTRTLRPGILRARRSLTFSLNRSNIFLNGTVSGTACLNITRVKFIAVEWMRTRAVAVYLQIEQRVEFGGNGCYKQTPDGCA